MIREAILSWNRPRSLLTVSDIISTNVLVSVLAAIARFFQYKTKPCLLYCDLRWGLK